MRRGFDLCTGAAPPAAAELVCDVRSASNSGSAVDPTIVSCVPVTP